MPHQCPTNDEGKTRAAIPWGCLHSVIGGPLVGHSSFSSAGGAFVICDSQGGSYPPRLQGLHRQMRHAPFAAPTTGPYFFTAPMKYSLHPGWNRHIGGSSGRISF